MQAEDNGQNLRRSERTRKSPVRFEFGNKKTNARKEVVTNLLEIPVQDQIATPSKPANQESFIGRFASAINPFGGRRKGTSSTSSASLESKKADIEADYEERIVEIENEILDLQEEVELSEVTVESLRDELEVKRGSLYPENPLYDAKCIDKVQKEMAKLGQELCPKSNEFKCLKIRNTNNVKRLQNEMRVLKGKHNAELKHVEEEQDLQLSSSEDEADMDKLAEKFESWRQNCMNPSPVVPEKDELADKVNSPPMLEDRFGKVKHIITSMIGKARQATSVKDDKPQSLIEFGTTVVNLAATIKSLGADGHMKNPQLLSELEDKLPYSIRIRWQMWRMAKAVDEDIEQFAEWIEAEMKMAFEMVTHLPKDEKKVDEKSDHKNKKRNAGVHNTGEGQQQQQQNECSFCGMENHKSYQCRDAKGRNVNDRVLLAIEKKMCLCCLRVGCSSRRCKNKRTCGIENCQKDHNRLFHGALPLRELLNQKENPNQVVHRSDDPGPATEVRNPVNVLQAASLRYVQTEVQGPNGKEMVLVLLDDGASIAILDEDIRRSIGANGPTKPFCMTTVEGDGYYPNAKVIGINIRGNYRNSQQFKIANTNPSVIEIERFSKLLPLLRTAALVYRWVSKSQNMKKQISVSELQRAELYWCGQVQKESFPEEVQLLTGGKPISKKSRLYKLDPKLCEDNLLRLRGRTGDANIPLT
ncbi:hypothetical protein Fcan01_22863, partial [Folsomia candida]